jgi:hypothetical protein
MAGLSEQKIAIVRTLMETAPDRIVGSLQQALAETPDGSALGGVRRLVETEIFDRTLRNLVLQPIAPMCVADGDPRTLTFPPRVLALLWRALRRRHAETVEQVRAVDEDASTGRASTASHDILVDAAADGIREAAHPEFVAVIQACEAARPGSAAQLADCLDIAPIVRRATHRLAEWIAHPGGDTTAGARLAYRDCLEFAEDAGPRFFHMLAAQMAQPWMVLRVISAVMDKPTERYLRDSELSSFGEAVFDDVDKTLHEIARLNPDAGAAAGRELAVRAELVTQQVLEIETSMDLQRDQGWGLRVAKQRANLANVVEGRLREAEKATVEALPMVASWGRGRRALPRLDSPPEARAAGRATTLLSFSEELRTTANYGGFASARSKMIETLSEYIDHYVDDVLDMVRGSEVEDLEIANAYLRQAAGFKQLLAGHRAGELIRRRALSAIHPEQAAALAAAEAHIAPLARF